MKPFALSLKNLRKNGSAFVCIIILSFSLKKPTKSVCKALNTYDNIILIGDFNIDINKDEAIGQDRLDEPDICYTNNHK